MLITEQYREMNRTLHSSRPDYGTSGKKYADMVSGLAQQLGVTEMLDYGCGKQTLADSLPHFSVHGYDPAIEGLEIPPRPHELVVCTDVLEHIEPELLDNVLDDLQRVTKGTLFVSVATRPAVKVLDDGRNAHLIQEGAAWWLPKLMERFDLVHFSGGSGEFLAVMVVAKKEGSA